MRRLIGKVVRLGIEFIRVRYRWVLVDLFICVVRIGFVHYLYVLERKVKYVRHLKLDYKNE
jgi:hypothetical protein